MQAFVSNAFRHVLASYHLDDFEHLWGYRGDWFESPNQGRGGWSGVNRLVLERQDGEPLGLFLKRQQNYIRRTLRHPFSGVATSSCQVRNIRHLADRGVPVPTLAFFAQKSSQQGIQAILVTEELRGYRSVDRIAAEVLNNPAYMRGQKLAVIASAASAVRAMHDACVQHRALHAKHLLVNMDKPDAPKAVIIDFEKARIKPLFMLRGLRDLATLNRDVVDPGNVARLYFFKQYLGVDKLGPWSKFLCRMVIKRSGKRRQPDASVMPA